MSRGIISQETGQNNGNEAMMGEERIPRVKEKSEDLEEENWEAHAKGVVEEGH